MVRLSVIIPVYNIEKHIGGCLESLFRQDLPESEYEIIIVDDGSTDSSAEAARAHMRPNCVLVSQPNKRQGAARNNALKHAKGEYVWFVDGDDAVKPNVLRALVEAAESQRLDAMFFRIDRVNSESEKISELAPTGEYGKVYGGREYLKMRGLSLGPWYVFRREFLLSNNLFFMEGVLYEDSELMPKICYYAKRIMNLDAAPYLYFVRSGSATTSLKPDRVADLAKVVSKMLEFCAKTANDPAHSDICYYAAMVFNTFFARFRAMNAADRAGFALPAGLKKSQIICAMFASRRPKYMFEAAALSILWNLIFSKHEK